MSSRALVRAFTLFATFGLAISWAGPARAADEIVDLTLTQGPTSVTLTWTNNYQAQMMSETLSIVEGGCAVLGGLPVPIDPPASGSMEITTGGSLGLLPGTYGFSIGGAVNFGGPSAFGTPCLEGTIADAVTPQGPPSWWQSVGRDGPQTACPMGWNPSWAHWMHTGTGGFVCNRELYWTGSGWAIR